MALVLGVVIVAAIAANVALLSLATGNRDSVGQLSPIVAFQPHAAQPRASARPTVPAPPTPEPSDGSGEDD